MLKIFKHESEQGWFVADESGVILIDGCADLDAAIFARQKLLARLEDSRDKGKVRHSDHGRGGLPEADLAVKFRL
jgi:hypothetical protein